MDNKSKVLFILKRHSYCYPHHYFPRYGGMSSGLHNSAQFVSQMLTKNGVDSKVVVVIDNNDIDREVYNYKPTHVVIEALWVVPEKFEILKKLHPNVRWIVRTHSEIPFLALEGIAIDWIKRYRGDGIAVAVNSLRTQRDLENSIGVDIEYLPNYYPTDFRHFYSSDDGILNVGCFGAIRPMKNQLLQAMAAISYANSTGLSLAFHINAGRVEQGESVLKNLEALFAGTSYALVKHGWEDSESFLSIVQGMDLVMSVSLTETFSLVTADAVSQGIPIVTSPEVSWAWKAAQADPTNAADIERKMHYALCCPALTSWINQTKLKRYSEKSQSIWLDYLNR